jgi:hypothetical protein
MIWREVKFEQENMKLEKRQKYEKIGIERLNKKFVGLYDCNDTSEDPRSSSFVFSRPFQ